MRSTSVAMETAAIGGRTSARFPECEVAALATTGSFRKPDTVCTAFRSPDSNTHDILKLSFPASR